MSVLMHRVTRQAEVWRQLDCVTDPELDESVTSLGFIEEIDIGDDGVVTVEFRLPTYWCSPNFAFMMAEDIRRAVAALPWVSEVRPALQEHMAAEEVNHGVRLGLSFAATFRNFETSESIEALRERFRRKAFERRQEALLSSLREMGYDSKALSAMTLAALDRIDLAAAAGRQRARYREVLIERGLASKADDLAFVRIDGGAIAVQEFAAHLRQLRGVRINMEFNSALCRGLLAARYGTPNEEASESEVAAPACGSGCARACGDAARP